MNSKTTLFLFAAFVGLAGGFWLLRPQKSISAPQTAQTPFDIVDTPSDRQKLVEKEIDEPVKIVIRLEDADVDWIFEKESGDDDSASPKWRMTAPIDTSVASWEMDKFDRQLLKGEYELSYDAGGSDGVTLAKAGLDPPQATVTMTDERGRSATVEIGLPVSAAESYVRLAGTDRICVLDVQLEYLLKKQALDYRDMQVWKIDRESVVGLEIVDRTDAASPVTYTFRKDGARWMIESPVAARGTNKIDELVRSALRLRATRWDDDDPSHFAMYGLAAPVRTVRIEIEKKVESGDEGRDSADDESSEEDPGSPVVPQTERVVHEFHLSDQSPIGEETKVYFRFDDSPVVGRISRTTADKFAPALDQWRDMQLTPAPVKTASRIELTTSAGSAVLFRIDGGQWKFEGDDATAQCGRRAARRRVETQSHRVHRPSRRPRGVRVRSASSVDHHHRALAPRAGANRHRRIHRPAAQALGVRPPQPSHLDRQGAGQERRRSAPRAACIPRSDHPPNLVRAD